MGNRRLAAVVAALALVVGVVSILPTGSTATPVSGFSARGLPLYGQALFGAASGNSAQDPAAREARLGRTLGIHRTYWAGNEQDDALHRAALDLKAGRLPWISFKAPHAPGTTTPYTWTQMAGGAGDAWAVDLARRLGTLGGPVWVAVHHEPDDDPGNLQDWTRMQQRLAPIFRSSANVAFTVILMGYHQFMDPDPDPALSMQALWPGSAYVDVTGFDPYNLYGTINSSGKRITSFTELNAYYTKIAAWSASVGGAPWAIAETGLTDLAAERDVAWISRAYDDMRAAGGIALAYWDNQFTPDGTFRLDSALKQNEFARVLARSDRVTAASTSAAMWAPASVRVKPKVTTASVRWSPPPAERPVKVSRYRLLVSKYSVKSGSWGRTITKCTVKKPRKTTCTVKRLRPGTRYRVVVQAVYRDGVRKGSPATQFRTRTTS